jgi:hypothetical protein
MKMTDIALQPTRTMPVQPKGGEGRRSEVIVQSCDSEMARATSTDTDSRRCDPAFYRDPTAKSGKRRRVRRKHDSIQTSGLPATVARGKPCPQGLIPFSDIHGRVPPHTVSLGVKVPPPGRQGTSGFLGGELILGTGRQRRGETNARRGVATVATEPAVSMH